MEIRVVVSDETGVARPMSVLARVWDAPSVSFDRGCNGVRALAKRGSNGLVVRRPGVAAVECIGWARVSLGFRSPYTPVGGTPLETGE